MDNTNNKIYFNFSYFALKLLGKGLYSNPWTAIAELVANGLDAKADKVRILIDMSDKKHSAIEIFDNGYGMSYSDLAEKYVLIGKNKREDADLDAESKNLVMGRKGIGKLAALYLSKRYYLISKTTSETSSWYFDMREGNGSEIPALNRIDIDNIDILSVDEWNKNYTGTMIKLENVDLTNIGIQSIEGLKARLSDYYLLDDLEGKIEIAVKYNNNDPIDFSEIKKNIAFKNFYALFDNSGYCIKDKMLPFLCFPSSYNEVAEKQRNTIILDADSFNTSGKQKFLMENGNLTDGELSYKLNGWIGIHASINKDEAQKNDPLFLKNKAYKSTKLRLYVRDKLAVEDFMPYLKNTQAFSNYIEGEISFDILDDNLLGDIATSNRQGFAEDDERITILIEILKPIVTSLIGKRVQIGKTIKKEEEVLKEKEEKERKEAETSAEKAKKEKDEAERKQKQAEEETKRERKRAQYVIDVTGVEDKHIVNTVHSIYNMSNRVKENLDKINNLTGFPESGRKVLKKAATSNQKILSVSKMISKAGGLIENNDAKKSVNLTEFIVEYVNKILKKIYDEDEIAIICKGDLNSNYQIKIKPLSFIMMIDNIIGNSIKAKAKCFEIIIDDSDKNEYRAIFKDNGEGVNGSIQDLNSVFEFGVTTTDGSGLGLFYAKKQMTSLKGTIQMLPNEDAGVSVVLSWKKRG